MVMEIWINGWSYLYENGQLTTDNGKVVPMNHLTASEKQQFYNQLKYSNR